MLNTKFLSLFSRFNRVVINKINIKSSEINNKKNYSTKMKDFMKPPPNLIEELNTKEDR